MSIDEKGIVHCPECDAIMKRLYWKKDASLEDRTSKTEFIFAGWYGCTDCGKYVFDKENMETLSLEETSKRRDEDLEMAEKLRRFEGDILSQEKQKETKKRLES